MMAFAEGLFAIKELGLFSRLWVLQGWAMGLVRSTEVALTGLRRAFIVESLDAAVCLLIIVRKSN